MKKLNGSTRIILGLIWMLLLTGLPSHSLFAQSNNWAPTGAIWHYDAFGEFFCLRPEYAGYFTMESVRDSTIQGKKVRVIERKVGGGLAVDERNFYMYEDSGRVYYFHENRNEFMLLYDFNAQPGDTLVLRTDTADFIQEFYGPNQSNQSIDTGFAVRVHRVDTVLLGGKNRRRQFVYAMDHGFGSTIGFGFAIVEGLGSLENMFGGYLLTSLCYHRGNLRCYQDTGASVQFFLPFDCTYIPSVGLEEETGDLLLQINSLEENGAYLLTTEKAKPYSELTCRIFGLTGQEAKSWSFRTDASGRCSVPFTLDGHPPGMYVLYLSMEGGDMQAVKLVHR